MKNLICDILWRFADVLDSLSVRFDLKAKAIRRWIISKHLMLPILLAMLIGATSSIVLTANQIGVEDFLKATTWMLNH